MKALTLALVAAVAFAAPAAAAPTPKFTIDPRPATVGKQVTFSSAASVCDAPPCRYTWRSIHKVLRRAKTLRYEFPKRGTKTITLIVRNSNGTGRRKVRRFKVKAPVATVPESGGGGPDPAQCTSHVAAGSSYSQATSGASSGAHVCLAAGTYQWGDYNLKAGVAIEASSGVSATVVGEARVNGAGATLDNLHLRAAASENHAVVSVDSADFTARRLEVDAQNVEHVQGFLVGGDRAKILDTVIHSVRGPGGCSGSGGSDGLNGTHFHGIYWYGSTNGEVRRIWMYDISGFGLHFYSGTGAGTKVSQTVTDDTLCNFGNVFDSQDGPVSFDKTFLTDAGGWRCLSPGATVSSSRSQAGFGGCSGSGNVTGDTAYANEAARDYRVVGDADMQFVPGPR